MVLEFTHLRMRKAMMTQVRTYLKKISKHFLTEIFMAFSKPQKMFALFNGWAQRGENNYF